VTHARRATAAVLALLVARAAFACGESSATGTGGYTVEDTGPPPPPRDARELRFCAFPTPGAVFCDDFDFDPLGSPPWTGDPGSPALSLSSDPPTRGERSLHAELFEDAGPGATAFLVGHPSAPVDAITCELEVWVDVAHPALAAVPFRLRMASGPDAFVEASLAVSASSVNLQTTIAGADAGPSSTQFVNALTTKSWTRMSVTVTPLEGTLTARSGQGTATKSFAPLASVSEVTISAGIASDGAPWRLFVDELLCQKSP
jgi:hypothetical protein